MPQFEYTAKSRDGKNSAGFVDAADRRGAIAAVERLGLIPLNVAQRSDSAKARPKAAKGAKSGSSAFKLARPNHMSANEVMLFTGELADLIEGGMTLGNALNCLASRGDGQSGPSQVITALRDAIIEGATFSSALEKYPKIFSPIYINMIRAGEASGAMTDVLQRLITFPNVLITSHQAYFTDTALQNIADTTIANLTAFENGDTLVNEVTAEKRH